MSKTLIFSLDALEQRRLLSAANPVAAFEADPSFAEGVLPRFLTKAERERIEAGLASPDALLAPTAPPTGPVDPVAEYDAMEGLVISWQGSSAWQTNLIQIARRVTVEGNSRVYCGLVPGANQTTIANSFASGGANLANMTFFTVPLNSIWVRDYGPRYVYEGDVRVITDHKYNRSTRTSDDNQPVVFSAFKQHQYYEIGLNGTTLIHGGGNYHLATDGDAYATELITNENPSFTAAQVRQIWQTYQNNDTTLTAAFPTNIDATQHIDMWMQIYADKKVFISDWPNAQGSIQDQICEATATLMQSRGYQVTRIPAYSIGGVHYTFANMVICNNVVLLPQYNNGPGATVSTQVFNQVQAAFTPLGKTVFQINADSIVTAAGVFHCIVQHVPAHRGLAGPFGGLAPTAMLRGPNDAPTYAIGSSINLQWITDDDAPVSTTNGVQGVDLLLSTDGGQTFPFTIATNRPALGSFTWNIPLGLQTDQAIIRVVARDALGNTGVDETDLPFTIDTTAPTVNASVFNFETEQRLELALNETATLGAATLTNLTTGQVIPRSQLQVEQSGEQIVVRKASGLLDNGNWRLNIPAAGLIDAVGNPSAALSVDFFVLAGDANRDRSVDISDFSILASNFNTAGTFSQGDFNYSGTVEIGDFSILAGAFNSLLPAARAGLPGMVAHAPRAADSTGFSRELIDILSDVGGGVI